MCDIDKDMRFHLLGPIRVFAGNDEVVVTGRERVLLVTLLYHADMPVGVDQLVDAIWGDQPPRDARNQVQSCVSRLRKRLAVAGIHQPIVLTEPGGYRIRVNADQLDVRLFRQLVAEARTAAKAAGPEDAIAQYRAALAIWRGPALTGIDSDVLRKVAAALEEEHLQAVEECIDLELTAGAAGELVADLTDLVGKHPYREHLHGALMLALYRAGRQAEALAVYQRARQILVDEIGTEPHAALRDLHLRILKKDPTLTAAVDSEALVATHSLPRSVGDFTGRQHAVARLVGAASVDNGATTVLTIDGMAGVGKTTLAIHVAHTVVDRYPDAQLFVDLHGHSERGPVEPNVALGTLLRQLGVPGGRIPIDLEGRVALWRHQLADRRALVVLDNAANSAQVAPLLPSGSGCLILVTSRRRLAGLPAARPLSLDVLNTDDAVALLQQVVGRRVGDEPAAAVEVVSQCGRLPLAIRLAGARLAHRPGWRVQDLADRLHDAGSLLTELTAEDHTVADALALSYEQLTPDLQRHFRCLGLHVGGGFDAEVLAALVDVPLDEARRALDNLVDHHLVDEFRPGRYRLHDLVGAYAHRLAMTVDSETERRLAIEGMLDFYIQATCVASLPIERPDNRRRLHAGEPKRPDLLAEPVRLGIAWLEEVRPSLVTIVDFAASGGFASHAWRLASAAWRFHYTSGYLDDLVVTHQCGLAAAELERDDLATAIMCNYLASAYHRLGNHSKAAKLLRRAMALWETLDDPYRVAAVQANLGLVLLEQGRPHEAVGTLRQAIGAQEKLENLDGIGICLLNLGNAHLRIGEYDEAARCLRRALAIANELSNKVDCAIIIGALGTLRRRLGDHRAALRLVGASLAVKRKIGIRDYESEGLNDLGIVQRHFGDYREALRCHREALTIALDVDDRTQVYAARNELGQTLREIGDIPAALEQHRIVLAEATKQKLPYEQAQALDGIAACLCDADRVEARRYWQRALVLYREMGVPEQAEVERRLAELGGVALGSIMPGSSGKTGSSVGRLRR